jgi:hypothetical protein
MRSGTAQPTSPSCRQVSGNSLAQNRMDKPESTQSQLTVSREVIEEALLADSLSVGPGVRNSSEAVDSSWFCGCKVPRIGQRFGRTYPAAARCSSQTLTCSQQSPSLPVKVESEDRFVGAAGSK